MKTLAPLPLALLCLFLLACSGSSTFFTQEELLGESFLFRKVNVLPMTSEVVLKDQVVWVLNGKIHKLGPEGTFEVPQGLTEIDGRGQFLLPGLAEMHAHIPQSNRDLMEETLFLYLSQGITTIRGMLGHPDHLSLRRDVQEGRLLGPRIFTSGPSCNGNTVPDPATARQRVEEQKKAGYDFLKLHPGLKRDVFDTLVATAKRVDIPYAGHVSAAVGIHRALAAKYASVDHLDRYLDGLVPDSEGVDPAQNGFFGLNYTDLMDGTKIRPLAEETKVAGVWNVPTMSMIYRWTNTVSADDLANEPEMKYMNPETIESWKQGKFSLTSYEKWDPERLEVYYQLRRDMLKALQEVGAGILLGSDAPQVFNVPGFSIHHEMAEMLASGLTPYQVLLSGTANPAIFFGQEGDFGTVVPGASADLMLVHANPLTDLTSLKEPAGVMVRGQWLERAELASRLADIAAKYADQ
jgi:imidazolonepropionase-like amidohydrolase